MFGLLESLPIYIYFFSFLLGGELKEVSFDIFGMVRGRLRWGNGGLFFAVPCILWVCLVWFYNAFGVETGF